MIDAKQMGIALVAFGLVLTTRASLYTAATNISGNPVVASEPKPSLKSSNRSSFRGLARLAQNKKESDQADVKEVTIKAIKLKVPANWKEEAPSNNLRLAQFKVPAAEGDKPSTEVVISSFGGDGGGVDQNFKRWVDQFEGNGRKVKMTSGDCDQGKYYVSDVTGTYLQSAGGPFAGGKKTPMPGYRSLSLVLATAENGVYFVRMTGPEKTVNAAAVAFRTSFGGDASKEADYELK